MVATEDHRLYAGLGSGPFVVARVIAGGFIFQPDQGGSTLHQQLARMLLHASLPGLIMRARGAASRA